MAGASQEETIEQIDIGGPSMVRGAAKNHASVAVVTSPDQYGQLQAALAHGGFDLAERQALAAAAFVHTATYDIAVASWMGNVVTDTSDGSGFPRWVGGSWDKAAVLRYGENPHQRAALYVDGAFPGGLATAQQLHGKEMSYNNYVDTDAARRAAYDFDAPAVAIIKHANPCGIAVGVDIAEAHARAHACDPVSAFGGVIATNRPVSVAMAHQVAEVFTEVIAAPAYEDGAVEVLQAKKNIRILVVDPANRGGIETRGISGGMLMQAVDTVDAEHDTAAAWELVSGEPATPERAGRPGVRLAGLSRGQIQRDPAGPRRRLGRGRHGSGQPGRLVSARGGAGGGPGEGLGGRVRRVLPVRRRSADPDRRRCLRDRAAGWLGP